MGPCSAVSKHRRPKIQISGDGKKYICSPRAGLVVSKKKKWLSAPAPAPPETQTPTKPDAESGSSIGEENPPPEIIWCDECAFRETAVEKKAELEALGIRLLFFPKS